MASLVHAEAEAESEAETSSTRSCNTGWGYARKSTTCGEDVKACATIETSEKIELTRVCNFPIGNLGKSENIYLVFVDQTKRQQVW